MRSMELTTKKELQKLPLKRMLSKSSKKVKKKYAVKVTYIKDAVKTTVKFK